MSGTSPQDNESRKNERRQKRRKKLKSLRTRLAAPWQSGAQWLFLELIVIWTGLCVVLLNVDLGKDETKAEPWLWGLIIVPWVLFIIGYVMASFAPKPEEELPYNVDYEMFRQCLAMSKFATQRGKTPDSDDLSAVQDYYNLSTTQWDSNDPKRVFKLRSAHEHLSRLVAPALPQTIVTMSGLDSPRSADKTTPGIPRTRHDGFTWLGSFRLARMMLGLALALLPLFIALAMTKGTSIDQSTALFKGEFIDKTLTAAYLVTASALGASFAALFKVRRYVENLSYDDQYESSYWVRFVLGLLAGLILSVSLSNLLPTDNQQFKISVPLLALIGGFSSDLVYRILKRLLDAIETLIQGSTSEIIEAERISSAARLHELNVETQAKADQKVLEAESREISALLDMKTKIPDDATGVEAREQLDQRLTELVRSRSPLGGGATALSVSPASLEFKITDGVPETQVVTITNTGEQALEVTGTAVHLAAGSASPFAITLPDTIEPGTTADVTVSVNAEATANVSAEGLDDQLQVKFGDVQVDIELVVRLADDSTSSQ
jgi:hypothetical protein